MNESILTDEEILLAIAPYTEDSLLFKLVKQTAISQNKKTAHYYETEFIPQRIKQAQRELIEEIEQRITFTIHDEDCPLEFNFAACRCSEVGKILCQLYQWQAIKKIWGLNK